MNIKKFFRILFPSLFVLSTGLFLAAVFKLSFLFSIKDTVVTLAFIISGLIFAAFIIRKVGIKQRVYLLLSAVVFFAAMWLFLYNHPEFMAGPAENYKWYVFVLGYFLFLPLYITALLILRHGIEIILNVFILIFKSLAYITKRSIKQPIWGFKVFGILAALVYIISLNIRLTNIEKRFGGAEKLKCSPDAVQKLLNEKVVRIEGSLGEGTGFPINEVQILTNFHVIDGDATPKIVFPDGSIETPVLIVGDRRKDVALLSVKRKLDPLPFFGYLGMADNAPNLTFGEPLYAAGYALGSGLKGGLTINKGSYTRTQYDDTIAMNLIITDATLVGGMSGGPLVNACGQVVGVNTQGVSGLSMFLDMTSVQKSMGDFSQTDVAKIKVDTTTPEGVVNAFYTYIGARDLKKAYDLIDPERLQGQTYDYWIQGYATTLQVGLISSKPDPKDKNKILIKLYSEDWVNGTMETKYFEGYWILSDNLKLKESQINTVKNPDMNWFYAPPAP